MELKLVSNHNPDENPSIANKAFFINGLHTEVVFERNSASDFVIVSHFEKVGYIYEVKVERPESTEPVYTVRTILGGENIEGEATVRYLAEELEVEKNLIIFLDLQTYDKTTVNLIAECLKRNFYRHN